MQGFPWSDSVSMRSGAGGVGASDSVSMRVGAGDCRLLLGEVGGMGRVGEGGTESVLAGLGMMMMLDWVAMLQLLSP